MDANQFQQFMTGLQGIFAQVQQGNQDANATATASAQQVQQALQAVAQAQQGAGNQPVPPPQQQPVFARTPGQANAANFIDYQSATGIKLWQEASASLTNKFDAKSSSVNTFTEALLERANKSGWNDQAANIISIPIANNQTANLFSEYGKISVQELEAFVNTYLNADGRQAQNDSQLYHCIKNSLTTDAERKILSERDTYHINNVPSGSLLFKHLMQKSIVDSRATVSMMKENLSNLDSYMTSVNSNVEEFNQYVKLNYDGLKARGHQCSDLLVHLWKAYLIVSDKSFVEYIRLKKIAYDDEQITLTEEELMALAEKQYGIIHGNNMWNAKSAEEEKIEALNAEFVKLKDENLKLSKRIAKKAKEDKKTKKDGKKKDDNTWAWKEVPPKEGQKHTKKFKKKTYHWCPHHNKWTIHTPQQCEKKGNPTEEEPNAEQAMAAVVNHFEPFGSEE